MKPFKVWQAEGPWSAEAVEFRRMVLRALAQEVLDPTPRTIRVGRDGRPTWLPQWR